MATTPIAADTINATYLAYGQRGATPAEVAYWQQRFAANAGDDVSTLRHAILNDLPLGTAALNAVRELYEDYAGRPAQSSEVAVWRQALYDGADLATVRRAIVADPVAGAHLGDAVNATFLELRGTAASASELSNWTGQIKAGSDLEALRGQLLADPAVLTRVDGWLAADYASYQHRAPTAAETTTWHGLFATDADRDTLDMTLLVDGAGSNGILHYDSAPASYLSVRLPTDFHVAEIDNFSPTLDTLSLADPSILGGASALDHKFAREVDGLNGSVATLLSYDSTHQVLINGVRPADLHDSAWASLNATNYGSYTVHMGRQATTDELGFWKDQFAHGVSTDTALEAILTDSKTSFILTPIASHTVRVVAPGETTVLTPGGNTGDFVVYGFDPAHDRLQQAFGGHFLQDETGAQLLSTAREITALDGHKDVLIDFTSAGAAHAVLLVDVHLADLSAANFVTP